MSLVDYQQTMEEDNNANRAIDAMAEFKHITRAKFFSYTPIVVLFTKPDMLEAALARTSFKSVFLEFKGNERNCLEVITFMKEKYESLFGGNIKSNFIPWMANLLDEKEAKECVEMILGIKHNKLRPFNLYDPSMCVEVLVGRLMYKCCSFIDLCFHYK